MPIETILFAVGTQNDVHIEQVTDTALEFARPLDTTVVGHPIPEAEVESRTLRFRSSDLIIRTFSRRTNPMSYSTSTRSKKMREGTELARVNQLSSLNNFSFSNSSRTSLRFALSYRIDDTRTFSSSCLVFPF